MSYQPKVAFHPGVHLADELETRNILQKDFAEILGISPSELSLIISGKRDITTRLAVRIGEAFGTGAELWISLQSKYNLWKFKQDKAEIKYLEVINKKMLSYAEPVFA